MTAILMKKGAVPPHPPAPQNTDHGSNFHLGAVALETLCYGNLAAILPGCCRLTCVISASLSTSIQA